MAGFTPSHISINSKILLLLETISRKQGELSTLKRTAKEELLIESIANIDAVHFSTRIEGNALSRDQVTQALESRKKPAQTRDLNEILNYSRVRRMIRDWAWNKKPFNEEWVLKHHAEILKGIVKGRLRGQYREAQCVIKDSKTRGIVYMAPEWKEVPELMRGLLGWLKKERLSGASPLLLAAQFHFEFVTIHPFMDGNGRLARLLTNGILLGSGYDVERYAALEKQHEHDRSAYYEAMRVLQSGNYYEIPHNQDIYSWVKYWLECLLATYNEALERVNHSAEFPLDPSGTLPAENRLRRAEALFRRHKRLRASEYCDLSGLGRTQAVADLNTLLDGGFIEKVGGGRSTLYKIRTLDPEKKKS